MAADRRVIAVTRPLHGLGNRLRVVLGGRALAEFTDREFEYTWPTGRSFGLALDRMWQFDARRIPTLVSRALSVRHPYRDAGLQWMAAAERDPIWQIRTAHALSLPEGSRSWESHLQELIPEASLAERITDFHRTHFSGRPYVGVSVRAAPTAHAATLEHSPVEWYLDRMTEITRHRPDMAFFLSADTEEAERRIVEAFPETFVLPDKGPINSAAALRSCVVEFYLLGSSTHILGPHYSSYPETAQKLAGPSLLLETSLTGPGTKWESGRAMTVAADPLKPSGRAAI